MEDDYEPVEGRVWLDDGYVVLDCPPTTYEIGLYRIETPLNLLGWCHQLTEKRWVTVPMLRQFIVLVCTQKGWQIHPI